ncbi:MAG: hypothetical protein GY794_21630 [bacterium]|nr:hypothetical protein [bacterium]
MPYNEEFFFTGGTSTCVHVKGKEEKLPLRVEGYGLERFAFDDVHMARHSQKHNKGLTE